MCVSDPQDRAEGFDEDPILSADRILSDGASTNDSQEPNEPT